MPTTSKETRNPSVQDARVSNLAGGTIGRARWGVQNFGYWTWWAEGPNGGTRSGAQTKAECIRAAKAEARRLDAAAVGDRHAH